MAELNFETLTFALKGKNLQVNLLNLFYTKIPLTEVLKLGDFVLKENKGISNTISFPDLSPEKAAKRFSFLLGNHFEHLKNSLNQNPAVYLHRNSGIPLIGNVSFGIIYRNSSLIEIKPVTSCNLNCIYCSVGEGQSSNKIDFVIEKDYLIEELQKLLDFVGEPVEVHIGVQGEPFLYADLIPLISDLYANKQITLISMDTNFTLVTRKIIEQLAQFKDKLRLNISLDAMDQELAEKMAGAKYNLKQVLEMIKFTVARKINILIAPVYLPGYNDAELEKIINFVKELGLSAQAKNPIMGIQNFLNYNTGRNPVKAKSWEEFNALIRDLEKKTSLKQKLAAEDFGIRKIKELPKPFGLDEVITAEMVCPDRFPNAVIATAKGRTVSVPDCEFRKGKSIKIRITRDKHNIFGGKLV
ncbi:MAG TPA: radical SAM protein [Candidatus Nanoarchaeia archaeon]|nr:radical SAM protein [Candidatus Nanoarchaeia archaeon]